MDKTRFLAQRDAAARRATYDYSLQLAEGCSRPVQFSMWEFCSAIRMAANARRERRERHG